MGVQSELCTCQRWDGLLRQGGGRLPALAWLPSRAIPIASLLLLFNLRATVNIEQMKRSKILHVPREEEEALLAGKGCLG